MTEREHYAAAWRQFGRYRLRALAVFAAPMPGIVIYAYIEGAQAPANGRFLPWLGLLLVGFWLAFFAYLPALGIRCPRCGMPFFGFEDRKHRRGTRCHNCDLGRFADPDVPEGAAPPSVGSGISASWLIPALSVPLIAITLSGGLDAYRWLACPGGTWVADAPFAADFAIKVSVCVAAAALLAWLVQRYVVKAAWWEEPKHERLLLGALLVVQIVAAAAAVMNGLPALYCVGSEGVTFRAGLLSETQHYTWSDMRRLLPDCSDIRSHGGDAALSAEMRDGQMISLADHAGSPFWDHLDTFAIAMRQRDFVYDTRRVEPGCPARYRDLLATDPASWHSRPW